jgi:hypothetical protein
MMFVLSAAFLISVVTMPWWACVALAVLVLAYGKAYWVVIAGGAARDLIFGAPQPALMGFSYIYTTVFIFLALISWYLHRNMLER